MEHFEIVIGLIGIMFLSIIGVYTWTYKVYKGVNNSLGDIYKTVNSHLQNNNVHANSKDLVLQEVCKVVHKNIADDLTEIKEDVKCLLRKASI